MGGSKTTQTNTVDPKLMALYNQNYAQANQVANQPFTPYTGERIAPFSATQQQGQAGILAAANDPTATNTLNSAVSGVNGLLGFQPQQVSASPYSANTISAPTPYTAAQLAGTDLTPYYNPFQSQVIDASISQNQHARDMQGVSDNAAATAAGAFGGSRQGVQRAETTAGYDRNNQQNLAALNSANFTQAQNAAGADVGARNAANQFNSTMAFNTGQFNANAQNNAGQFNSAQNLQAQTTNAGNDITGAGLRLNASGILGNLSSQQLQQALQRSGAIEAVGANQTAMQQAQDQAAYEEFMRQLQYPYEQQQLRNQALGMMPLQQTQTTSQKGDVLGGILGTLAGGAKIGASMYGG